MSATSQGASAGGGGGIVVPPGVLIGAGRETSQTSPQNGSVVQGMLFPVTLPNQSTTSVFVPYNVIENTAYVQQLFDQRINSIMAIANA